MPLGYEYKRYFIILQEEDKGYEMTAGKIPTGYVKIEIKKDKVRVGGFIQNMKSDTRSQYKLNLLAPDKKLVLDIGLFRMDGAGRGEFYAEFDSDNVSGSNLSIGEFTGALVVAGSGIPLVGYAGRDSIPWRDWYGKDEKEKIEEALEEEIKAIERVIEEIPFIDDNEEIRQQEIMEEIPEAEEAMPEREQTEEVQEEEETAEVDNVRQRKETAEPEEIEETIEPEIKGEIEAEREAIVEPEFKAAEDLEMRVEPAPLYYEEPDHSVQQSFHGWDASGMINDVQGHERHKEEKEESHSKVHKRLHEALRGMERFDEFHDEYGLRWYRIGRELPLLNDILIPINGAMMPLSYPYIVESAGRNIENSVLGVEHRKGEIRYVYIGIPGMYNQACKSCYEYKGFTDYRRTKNNKRGYWIMCLDIMKGKVCRV